MRHRGLRIVTAGLAMLPIVPWLFASAAVQQAKQNQKATVEVKAAPEKVLPGEKVTINGTTDIDAKTPALTIAVTNTVSHSTVTITATANSEGVFSTVYEKTQTSGKYEVVANSPSGRASGRTFFTVLAPAAIVGDIGGEVQNDVAATRELLEEVAQMVPTLPDSPPKQELQQRMGNLRDRMSEFQQKLPDATDAFDKLKDMLQKAPETGKPLEKYTQGLRDWDKESQQQRARKPKLTHANTICDQLDRINEGLNWMSLLFDLVGKPLQIVNNIFFDKFATDALSSTANIGNDNAKFTISQFLKVGLVGGGRAASQNRLKETVDLEGTIIGMIGDLSQFVMQKLFGISCDRFTGTFTASLNAEFSMNLEPWWRYTEDFTGVLELRYPKNSPPGQPVAMTGEFQGVATRYTVWENSINVLFPKLSQGAVTFHVRRPPIGTPFHPEEMKLGKVAFNLFPKAFHIPVTAEYHNNKIRIHLQPAASDLNEVAKVTYVFMTPLTLLIPAITTTELPYKDAHFVLGRAANDGAIELPVTSSDGKLFIASAEMRNSSGPRGQAEGNYKMNIKICNPGCP